MQSDSVHSAQERLLCRRQRTQALAKPRVAPTARGSAPQRGLPPQQADYEVKAWAVNVHTPLDQVVVGEEGSWRLAKRRVRGSLPVGRLLHGPQVLARQLRPQTRRQGPEQASHVGDGPQAGSILQRPVDRTIGHEEVRMWSVVPCIAPHDQGATKQTHADHAERPGVDGLCGLGATQNNLGSPYVLGGAYVARQRHPSIYGRDGTTQV